MSAQCNSSGRYATYCLTQKKQNLNFKKVAIVAAYLIMFLLNIYTNLLALELFF